MNAILIDRALLERLARYAASWSGALHGWKSPNESAVKSDAKAAYLLLCPQEQARAMLAEGATSIGDPVGVEARIPIPTLKGCWRYNHPSFTGAYFDCPKCKSVRRFLLCGPDWHRCWKCDFEFGCSPLP